MYPTMDRNAVAPRARNGPLFGDRWGIGGGSELAIACRVRPRIIQCARARGSVRESRVLSRAFTILLPLFFPRLDSALPPAFTFSALLFLVLLLLLLLLLLPAPSSRAPRPAPRRWRKRERVEGKKGERRRSGETADGKRERAAETERRRKEAESPPLLRGPLHARSFASTLLRRSPGLDHPAVDSLTVLYATPLCLKETGLSPLLSLSLSASLGLLTTLRTLRIRATRTCLYSVLETLFRRDAGIANIAIEELDP